MGGILAVGARETELVGRHPDGFDQTLEADVTEAVCPYLLPDAVDGMMVGDELT